MDQVLETAPILLFVIDLAGTVTFLEAQHRVIGIDPQLALGKPAFECFKDAPEVLERLHAALAGESFSGLIRIAGNGPFADLTCHPLRGPEGAVIGVSGVLLDATERVRSDEVRRGVEARSLLIATMNHEARTPLNAILGFAELLGSGRHGELNEGQRHYLANIDSAGRQLLSLVSDAIDLTQLERGTLVLSPANLVVASVLEDVIERLQPFAAARDVRLVAHSDPDLTVHADRARLLQVLWSLASNGIRFTPHGGMVSLTALPSVPFTHIDVTDTGPGIPAHRLSRIYLEFIGEGSPDEGAGLGLSLTRQLVVLMGGRITVSSRLGAGTTFTLRLPASG
jgi:signal transduction histidine kinase